jgi:DNA-binding NarL/FixJ family response regulator
MSCQLLADALERSKHYEAVASVSAADVLPHLSRRAFDVVLLSATLLPETVEVFALAGQIKATHPDINTVVLLDNPQRDLIVAAFRSGALGVFCRSDSFQALCKCIQCVHEGQVWANSAELDFVLEALLQPVPMEARATSDARPLSKREAEIARLVADGLSNRQISERLRLSEHTVKNYLFRIFEKLGVATRVELALYFLKRGQNAQAYSSTSAPRAKGAEARKKLSR